MDNKSHVSIVFPIVGGAVGIFIAKLILPTADEIAKLILPTADETMLPLILSAILLLLSLSVGIGSLSFVKWLIVRKNQELF